MNEESKVINVPKPNSRCKLCHGNGIIKWFINPKDKIGKVELCDCVKNKMAKVNK